MEKEPSELKISTRPQTTWADKMSEELKWKVKASIRDEDFINYRLLPNGHYRANLNNHNSGNMRETLIDLEQQKVKT